MPSTQLTVVKTWVGTDADNQEDVVAGLFRTTGTIGDQNEEAVLEAGTPDQRTVTLNSERGWTQTFVNLPAYNAEGEAYTYYAKELSVGGVAIGDGYDVEYHYGNGITHITNFGGDHQEDYVRVIGTKTWVDNGLQPGRSGDRSAAPAHHQSIGRGFLGARAGNGVYPALVQSGQRCLELLFRGPPAAGRR